MTRDDDETLVADEAVTHAAHSTELVGRYDVGELLGRGGSGQVHRAVDRLTGTEVAVKFVPHLSSGHSRQLRRELTALRLLDLPGVVRLLDDGQDAGQTFLVMELLPGGRFDRLAERGGWETWEDEAFAMLEALERVHLAGVVHRDLKPGNILLDADQRPVLTDFGLAQGRAVEEHVRRFIEGSPRYMAPEQRAGEACDARTDLYALGVMFDEMLAGIPVPDRVRAVIDAMRQQNPSDRPADVREVLDQLGATGERVPLVLPDVSSGQGLQALFVEPEVSFLHLAEDAAAVLHERTEGRADEVRAELDRWVRAGRCRWEGDRIAIDRQAVERLQWEGEFELPETIEDAVVAARGIARRGRPSRALALLEAVGAVVGCEDGLIAYVDLSLEEGSDPQLRKAQYYAERMGQSVLVDLLAGARLGFGCEYQRAYERLSLVQAPAELVGWRWALLIFALGRVDRRLQREALDAAAADARADSLMTARWEIWAGNAAYAAGDHARAAWHHERAAAGLLEHPTLQLAALTNGAAAKLEVPDLSGAVSLAGRAAEIARALRHATGEARSWWIRRTAAYRSGARVEPQTTALPAVRAVIPGLEAQVAATEAAIAWRAGALEEARSSAERAAELFNEVPDAAVLMRSLALVAGAPLGPDLCGHMPADPSLGLQAAALVAMGGRSIPQDWPLAEWAAAWPLDDADARLDVMSLAECREALRLDQ